MLKKHKKFYSFLRLLRLFAAKLLAIFPYQMLVVLNAADASA